MQKRMRSTACLIFMAAVVLAFGPVSVQAQNYPTGPVQIIVPYGPGGTTDIFWRTIADALGKNIGGTISILNKPGGGGIVGTSFVVNTKPDGYTLVNISPETISIAAAFTPTMPYDTAKDITYIAKTSLMAVGIAVRDESPLKSFEDLVAFAKANPWKLKAGGMGIVGTPHMILGVFTRDAKVDITYVPFDGGGEVATNLLGGHVDFAITSVSSLSSLLASKKVRLLAVCSPKRVPSQPDIPTVAEKGYPKSSFAIALGLGGPAGLPRAIVTKWEQAIEKTLQDPNVIAAIEKVEGVVVDFKSGKDYYAEIMDNADIFKEIAASRPTK